jgi:UDP-glucose 4-epimerase
VLRLANPFGERQRAPFIQGVIAAFLYRALTAQPIEVWGDGSVVRDYLYVGDAADALVRALEFSGSDRVMNIGSGVGRSVSEIIEAIERATGRSIDKRSHPQRAFDVPANVLDIARARACLGWAPQTSFDEALRRTVEWIRQELA